MMTSKVRNIITTSETFKTNRADINNMFKIIKAPIFERCMMNKKEQEDIYEEQRSMMR